MSSSRVIANGNWSDDGGMRFSSNSRDAAEQLKVRSRGVNPSPDGFRLPKHFGIEAVGAAYARREFLKRLAVPGLAIFPEFVEMNHLVRHGHQQGLQLAVEVRGNGNHRRVG